MFSLDAQGRLMACGDCKWSPTSHLDFDGLTLAGVGPLAFQGLTCGGSWSPDGRLTTRSEARAGRMRHVGRSEPLSQRFAIVGLVDRVMMGCAVSRLRYRQEKRQRHTSREIISR